MTVAIFVVRMKVLEYGSKILYTYHTREVSHKKNVVVCYVRIVRHGFCVSKGGYYGYGRENRYYCA